MLLEEEPMHLFEAHQEGQTWFWSAVIVAPSNTSGSHIFHTCANTYAWTGAA